MQLLEVNIPDFFAEEELGDFSTYLDKEIEQYFVLFLGNTLVACGGINFERDKYSAKISWDVVHPDFQGKGLGSQLLQYRLDILTAEPEIQEIMVRTSQHVYQFYEKRGFRLVETQQNYWAQGMDLYKMIYIGE